MEPQTAVNTGVLIILYAIQSQKTKVGWTYKAAWCKQESDSLLNSSSTWEHMQLDTRKMATGVRDLKLFSIH